MWVLRAGRVRPGSPSPGRRPDAPVRVRGGECRQNALGVPVAAPRRARFVVGGQAIRPEQVDLRTVGVVLEKNGEPVALGAGAAVLGHPAAAIAMLANHLGRRGQEIPAGSLILSGGVTEAVAVNAGDNVTLRVQGMGSVGLRFA